ncbi:hypothetical protein Tco_0644187 [Tanacetum coccineum]
MGVSGPPVTPPGSVPVYQMVSSYANGYSDIGIARIDHKIQRISVAAEARAWYSASVLVGATICSFLELQPIKLDLRQSRDESRLDTTKLQRYFDNAQDHPRESQSNEPKPHKITQGTKILKRKLIVEIKSLLSAVEVTAASYDYEKLARKNEVKRQEVLCCCSSKMNITRLQKLISQLEILGETISQEDMNLKLLRSLPSEWKTHTLIWRNKPDLETLSMDDLYNNMKIYEAEVMGECKAPKHQDNKNREITRRTMPVEETTALVAQDGFGYDWSDQAKEGPTNFALMAYTSSSSLSSDTETKPIKTKIEKAKKERDDLKLTLEKFENSSKNLSKLLDSQVSDKFKTGVGYDSQGFDSQVFDSQVNDKYKTGEGYHAVPPPYTGNFMPPKPDLVLADKDEYVFSESVTSVPAVATSEVKTSESKPKSVSEPLIEDWISDSENENETEFKSKQRKPSFAKVEFVKSNKHVKSLRESVKKVENNKQAKYPRKNSQSPRGNKRNWNN